MEEQSLSRQSPSAQISNALVGLVHDYTGRGPTKARTVISGDSVTVLMADLLTKHERAFVPNDEQERVLANRHATQRIMKAEAIAIVEEVVDRKVIAFMSANHVNPDMAAEIFVLAPAQ